MPPQFVSDFVTAVQLQERKHLNTIAACFGLFVIYLLIYHDVVFFPRLIGGIDFQIRSTNEPWRFYFTDWSIWSSMGSQAGLGWTNWGGFQNAVLGIISLGNEVILQKLMFSGILFASFTMFFFLKNHITKITPVAFMGSIIFAYSPLTTSNYGTGIIWELAYLPIVMNYLINMFRKRASIKDSCLFAIALSFMVGFGAHVLPFVVLTLIVFLFAYLPTNRSLLASFAGSVKRILLAAFIFCLINPGIVNTAIYLFLGRTIPSTAYTGLSQASPQNMIAAYSSWTMLQQLTLSNWLNWGHVSVGWIPLGILFSVIAFSSLLFKVNGDFRKLVYGLAITYVLIIIFVLNVQAGTSLFFWIFTNLPFMQIMAKNTVGPSWFIGFVLAALIAVTISRISLRFAKPASSSQPVTSMKRWSLSFPRQFFHKRFMSTLLVVILLCAYFVYVPSFSPTTHAYSQGYFGASNNSEPIPNPQVYTLIIDFLNNADVNGSSRYFLVPNTFLSTLNLGGADPYIFGPSLSSPTSQVMQYLGFVDNLVANNETANLGALLAPANVKYVMVIRNSTEPDSTVGTMQGALRQTSLFGLDGDPQLFIDFLSKQKDLKLVAENQYYAAYENLDFLPYIECYSSMTYIEGDLNTIPMLSTLPNYNSNSTLLFFGDDNTNASGSVLDLSNNLLFYNRGATDLLISSMFSDYGVSLTGIGTTDSSKIAENWVWNNDVQSNTGFLTYGNGCLETTSEKSFELPFLIKYPESYGIWARVLYSTYSNGTLTFSVNGVAIDKLLNTQTDTDEGFVWINVSNLTLDQKQYVLTIGNSGGYSALGGIVIAPTGEITNTQNVISENMASKKVLYLYDTDSPFIKVSTNETTTGVNGETTTYTLSAFLPNGEYSMAVESPSVANDSLVNFNLGGNNVQATNRFDNWISSGIIALTGGTYSFSLTLKGNCTADEIAVVAGSLPEFWENQDENFSYITTGYSSYKVTINNTVPLFISLGEAYDPGWQALLSNQPVMHFAAFSFTNGFYVPPEGSATIELTYLPSTNVIFNRIALILFIAVLVGVVVITIYNSSIKKSRALKSKHSINWVMESN